jgi:REP element-mobilizing transposase RayT
MPVTISVSHLLQELKQNSSKLYKEHVMHNDLHLWNEGYSAYTVSEASIPGVKNYFANEVNRHRNMSVGTELAGFLNLHEIPFKPQFVANTTYTQLNYHFIWSTKHRMALLEKNFQHSLHDKITQIIESDGGKIHAIGNVEDHIHVLVECQKTTVTADLIQLLKTKTTHHIKSLDKKYSDFSWQEGYGVFSVGKPALQNAIHYVLNQEEHHKVYTSAEEFALFEKQLESLSV